MNGYKQTAIVLTQKRKKYSPPPLVIYLGYYNIEGAKEYNYNIIKYIMIYLSRV